MRARGLTMVLVLAGLAAACTTSVEQSPSPPTAPPPSDTPDAVATCPELGADPQASLGPEFDEESLAPGASNDIAAAFVASLEGLYAADPDADPCVEFSETGLNQAKAVDDRLGMAMAGVSRLDAELALRNAGEGSLRPAAAPADRADRHRVRHPRRLDHHRRRVRGHGHDPRPASASASG